MFAPARYAWIEASTKAGKTHGCIVWITERACLHTPPGGHVWWIAPRVRQAAIAFRRTLAGLPRWAVRRVSRTDMSIELVNGVTLWFKTGEHPDDLYGEDVHAAVIDEASRIRHDAFVALRSTLTATRGPMRIIGNVKGKRNWFWRGCRAAEHGLAGHTWARINAEDAADAGIFPRAEIDDARLTLPEASFRELYLALPSEEGDSFFATDRILIVEAAPKHCTRARGWDFAATEHKGDDAKGPDWTVGALLGHTPELTYVIDVARDRKAPDGTLAMLDACAVADGDETVIVIEEERGAAGKTMVAGIRRHLRNLEGGRRVVPAPVSGDKPTRAFEFATRVNGRQVRMIKGPWNDAYLAELDEFPNPEVHDDQVDATAHAYNYLTGRGGGPRIRTL